MWCVASRSSAKEAQSLTNQIDVDLLHHNWQRFSGIDDEMNLAEFENFATAVNLNRRTAQRLWNLLDRDGSGIVSSSELSQGLFELKRLDVWTRYCPACAYANMCSFCQECNQTCAECTEQSFCSRHWAEHPGRPEAIAAEMALKGGGRLRESFGTAAYFRAALMIRPLEWAHEANNGLGVKQKAWLRQLIRRLKDEEAEAVDPAPP
jgi:hypothetical protein